MADVRENKFDVQLGKPASGNWGHDLDGADGARQALPDPDLHGDGVYDAASALNASGDGVRLGDDIAGESSLQDDDYPRLPASPGPVGGTSDLSFDSVAPYKYPEFGAWPNGDRGFTVPGTSISD